MESETLLIPPPPTWSHATLGAICDQFGGGVQTGPFGSQLHASDYVDHGVPSVMPKDLKDGRVATDSIARVTPEDIERLSKYKLQVGDIVYSRRGDVERHALVTETEDGWLCGTGCLRIRPPHSALDSTFFHFYLDHPEVRSWIVRHAQGATMPNLNTGILRGLPLTYPPLDEQKHIAEILGAFDDKIELNRKMSRTLEAMAQALFKSWFVDFDGHDDDLVDSELGPSPRGWKIERLQDHVDIEKGLSYKGKYLESDGTPLVNLNSVLEGGGWKESGLKFYSGPCKPRHEIVPGDLVVANTEQGHKYLLIGCPAIVPRRIGGQGIFTHHLYRVRTKPDSPLTTQFVYHLLLEPNFRRVVTSYTNGTTVNGLFKDGLRRPKIRVPSSGRAGEFDRIAVQLQSRREVAAEQSRTLAEIRDTLLPKLISGEIRVPEAEKLAEAAV